jgi:hypothetical protein
MYLRPDLDKAIGMDAGGQFVFQQLFLVLCEQVRVPDREIAFHHGLDLIDILTSFSAAAGCPKNYFFCYIDLHVILAALKIN